MTSLRFTTRVPVFDSNIGVGHRHDRPSPVQDTEGLLEEMHRHGIERALIYHVQGETISGIDGNEALTLEQIGGLMNLTRERVRQLKERALSKLRHPARYQALLALLDENEVY